MEKKLIQTPHIVAFLDFLGASEKMRDPAKNDKFLQMVNAVYTLSLSISGKIKKYDNIKNEIKVHFILLVSLYIDIQVVEQGK